MGPHMFNSDTKNKNYEVFLEVGYGSQISDSESEKISPTNGPLFDTVESLHIKHSL
jgi:hypothetical protein